MTLLFTMGAFTLHTLYAVTLCSYMVAVKDENLMCDEDVSDCEDEEVDQSVHHFVIFFGRWMRARRDLFGTCHVRVTEWFE